MEVLIFLFFAILVSWCAIISLCFPAKQNIVHKLEEELEEAYGERYTVLATTLNTIYQAAGVDVTVPIEDDDYQDIEREVASELLHSSFTSRKKVIWNNPSLRALIIKHGHNGLPESVSVETAVKLTGKHSWNGHINKRGRIPVEIALDSVLSEYGYEGTVNQNAIDQFADDCKVLHGLWRDTR